MTRLLIGTLIATVIAVFTAEIAARLSGAIDRINIHPRRLFVRTENPLLPYRLRPGVEVTTGEVFIRVNRFGLRGSEISFEPAEGVQRILVLGDSVVFGAGLNEEDTFTVRIDQALREGGRSVEVLNGGALGYNTEAEMTFLSVAGLLLAPDALILGVSLNDFDVTPKLSPLGYMTQSERDYSWLSTHSELYVLVHWFVKYLGGGHWWQRAGSHEETRQSLLQALERMAVAQRDRFYAKPAGPAWDRVRRSLRKMRDTATEEDFGLTLVIFPEKDQVGIPEPNLVPQRHWAALCKELDLRCLDLWPAFSRAAGDGPLFRDLQHPNGAGMRVAASAVAANLLLP